jgi:serine/threonine-protein kinase
MELLIGGSFADKIDGQSAMDVGDCVAIIGDVAAGLAFAHRHGVVHRDVKPMNILFAADATPKLTDFGSAKLTESIVHTREGMTLGSPAYMSPEQITGAPVGYCSDIYSLGVSLYQALTGTVPFEGDTSSILAQHVNQPPRAPSELNPAIPDLLDEVLLIMLSKAAEDRFQDAESVISALRDAVA